MKERWKEFRHGYYEVSNKGKVRRAKPGPGTWIGKILKAHLNSSKPKGRLQVRTTVDGKAKMYLVHVIVARKFIGPCPEGKEVNHKDLNRFNNRSDNLEYTTHRGNMKHAVKNGVYFGNPGEKHPGAKLTNEQAERIAHLYRHKQYNQYELAEQFNVSQRTVFSIVHGEHYK